MIAVGLFAEKDQLEGFSAHAGLLHGGGFYLLGVQFLACVCFILWSGTSTFLIIKVEKLLRCLYGYNNFLIRRFEHSVSKFIIFNSGNRQNKALSND